ncbi:cadherin-13 [Gadus morhua]|uniref:cadherin-13 n=1 Tax=Gadus morhua TaxID=8049 RepID=UPI0011B65945|nr:cadherin-13 [Gadus morhua]
MDTAARRRLSACLLVLQMFHGQAQEDRGGGRACIPGFQVKNYQLDYSGAFRKDRALAQLAFDDCAGNEDVAFLVSHADFAVDENLRLVVRQDVPYGGPVTMAVHAAGSRADDVAAVEVKGRPPLFTPTQDVLRPPQVPGSRAKRSLLVPPMMVTENQRGPFPRVIGRAHVMSLEQQGKQTFHLTGPGADQDPQGLFSIAAETGVVSVSRSLDREASDSYQLEVSTSDLGGARVEGPAVLLVTVIDQNDNRPIFSDRRYSGEVLEGSPTGTTVMTMTAHDADDPLTDNAALRYSIARQSPDKPSANMFYIDPERGDIVTVISPSLLDRETLPTTTYQLEIVAKDLAGSEVGLTGTATATITITDHNDHAPEFTHPLFEAQLEEGSVGVVVNLTVDDRDDPATGGWRAVYSIVSGDPRQSFSISTNPDNNEGMLAVVKPLDYEASAFHSLLVWVQNEEPLQGGGPSGSSSTATVQVALLDVNEGPRFSPDPLMVSRMEDLPVGSLVASLTATDPDLLQRQSIRYAVLRDPAGWLAVHPVRGTVNTTTALDRESPHVRNNQYTAVFIATDNGSPPATGTGSLVVHLGDVNDQAPSVFPATVRVCEAAREVGLVEGRDRDLDPNAGPFRIELGAAAGLQDTWEVSRVNATHSQILMLQPLKSANYRVPLLITDSGDPALSSSTELRVQVCVCRKSRMICSSASSLRARLLLLAAATLLSWTGL